MGIFSKKDHRHADPLVRIEAVEKLTDPDELVEVACNDDSPRVRMAAVSRLLDDRHLFQVAVDARELDVRLAAVERITSQSRLAEIIKVRKNYQLMGACFARITDRAVLESIAQDTGYNPTARRMAVEQFADESYLSDLSGPEEEDSGSTISQANLEALMNMYGGVRLVRAIGRFRRSEKALKALGKIARQGGETAEMAVDYLCRALSSSNQSVQETATAELATLKDPDLVDCMVRSLDDSRLREPIHKVLEQIDTPQAQDALGRDQGKANGRE